MKNYNQKEKLQILQIWFSPSFPIGSYVYSHGLEAMIEGKIIKDYDDVMEYINSIVFYGSCKNDFIFIKSSYEGLDLNDLALAICSSKERKIETLALGNAFQKILKESWGCELPKNLAYPICVAQAGKKFKISSNLISMFFLQSFISNLINVCVKHIPLGQKIGQDCARASIDIINEFFLISRNYSLDNLGSICFNADIYSIKHENQISRVYSS